MNKQKSLSPAVLAGFGLILVVLIAVAWWLGGDSGRPAERPAAVTQKATTPTPPTTAPTVAPPTAPVTPATQEQPTQPMAQAPVEQTAEEKARLEADYRIGNIISEAKTVDATRDKLLLLFPSFTRAEKIMAAPHLVNLTEDPHLPRLLPHLMNPLTPPEAQETIFNDMLNRPPQIGWPVLIDVMAQPKHPLGPRAKELMTTIVGGDHGENIAAWRTALDNQLKAQGIDPVGSDLGSAPVGTGN